MQSDTPIIRQLLSLVILHHILIDFKLFSINLLLAIEEMLHPKAMQQKHLIENNSQGCSRISDLITNSLFTFYLV